MGIFSGIKEGISNLFKTKTNNLLIEDETKNINESMDSYISLLEELIKKGERDPFRRAIIMLNAHDNKIAGNNASTQEKLLNKLRKKSDKYRIVQQVMNSKDGDYTTRYAVSGNEFDTSVFEKEKCTRIYLNLERKNISKFAEEFIKKAGKMPFYFKFSSDEGIARRNKTDNFVIYLKDEESKSRVYSIINEIKTDKPNLMNGTNKRNPFLPKGKFLYTAETTEKEQELRTIKLANGQSINVRCSYNNIISYLIEGSLIALLEEQFGQASTYDYIRGEIDWKKNLFNIYGVVLHDFDMQKRLSEILRDSAKQNGIKLGEFEPVNIKDKLSNSLSEYKYNQSDTDKQRIKQMNLNSEGREL